METTRASLTWTGPEKDVLMLFREPTPLWEADSDENDQETHEITGMEIFGFLTFDRWDEPGPLVDVLKRRQELLRR